MLLLEIRSVFGEIGDVEDVVLEVESYRIAGFALYKLLKLVDFLVDSSMNVAAGRCGVKCGCEFCADRKFGQVAKVKAASAIIKCHGVYNTWMVDVAFGGYLFDCRMLNEPDYEQIISIDRSCHDRV